MIKSYSDIKNNILNNMLNKLSKIEGSYNYDIASSVALDLYDIYKLIEFLERQAFPWSVTEDEYLDKHMQEFGLTRRQATPAVGEVTFNGVSGATVPRDTIVISRTGVKYKTTTIGVLDILGKYKAKIECLESGPIGNCGIGDIQTMEVVIPNVFKVTNEEKIDTGYDIEPFEYAIDRMAEKARKPAHSGNVNDYELWARSIEGVGKSKCFDTWEGAGTVKVLISDYALGPAPQELIDETYNYIQTVRPIGPEVIVDTFTPYNFTLKVDLRIKRGYLTQEEATTIIYNKLKGALADERFTEGQILSIGRIGALILSIEGIINYSNLSINDETTDYNLGFESVAVLEAVLVGDVDES